MNSFEKWRHTVADILLKLAFLTQRVCNGWALNTFLFNPVQQFRVNSAVGTWYIFYYIDIRCHAQCMSDCWSPSLPGFSPSSDVWLLTVFDSIIAWNEQICGMVPEQVALVWYHTVSPPQHFGFSNSFSLEESMSGGSAITCSYGNGNSMDFSALLYIFCVTMVTTVCTSNSDSMLR